MKKSITIIAVMLLITINTFSQAPNWAWAKTMYGSGIDGQSIAIDTYGNVYTTGWFQGTVDFDPGAGVFNLTSAGGNDVFISKLDASGNFIWAKRMGGTGNDIGNSIAIDTSGNVYTTGTFSGMADFDPGVGLNNLFSNGGADIFISKLDSAGNFLWAKAIGGAGDDDSKSIAVDASGNAYTTGSFQSSVDFDPGAGTFNLTTTLSIVDGFISKLDASGNFVWAKAIGGTNDTRAFSIALDASRNVYTTGGFNGTVDFDPGVGTFNITSAGGGDIFISKLDVSGNFVWAKVLGGTGADGGSAIALDASNNVYTTGFFAGTADFDPGAGTFNLIAAGVYDIFISKIDSLGNFIWAKGIGGTGYDYGNSIAVDALGNVYTTGAFVGTVDFDPNAGTFNLTATGNSNDIFISKLDSSGNFLWAKATGGTISDVGNAIALNASGNIYVTGFFYSPTITLGSITLNNADNTGNSADIFIAKLNNYTGIEEYSLNHNSLTIFPNPANEILNIIYNNSQLSILNSQLLITDIIGNKIYELPTYSTQSTIDVSKWSRGVYFLQVKNDRESLVKKIIIQ